MKKLFTTIALSASLLNVFAADTNAPANHKPGDIVARIGKTEIKWQDLDSVVNDVVKQSTMQGRPVPVDQMAAVRYNVLDRMVTQELLLQDARKNPPADLDAKVKEQLDRIRQREGNEETFKQHLTEAGLTLEKLTEQIRDGITVQENVQRIVNANVKVEPADCQKFFDDNRGQFRVPEMVRASHILILCSPDATAEIKTQKLAQARAAQALVKGGDKFEDVARKFSEDTTTAKLGGDLGYFAAGQMVREFDTAVFALKQDEVSDVVATQFGYHLIKLHDRKPPGERTFAEVKDDIERYLRNQRGQEVGANYMKTLREQIKVEVLLPAPVMPPVGNP